MFAELINASKTPDKLTFNFDNINYYQQAKDTKVYAKETSSTPNSYDNLQDWTEKVVKANLKNLLQNNSNNTLLNYKLYFFLKYKAFIFIFVNNLLKIINNYYCDKT